MRYISGWWLTYPSEKYDIVSWDDFPFPTIGEDKIHVPNHQSGNVIGLWPIPKSKPIASSCIIQVTLLRLDDVKAQQTPRLSMFEAAVGFYVHKKSQVIDSARCTAQFFGLVYLLMILC